MLFVSMVIGFSCSPESVANPGDVDINIAAKMGVAFAVIWIQKVGTVNLIFRPFLR